MIYCDMDSVLVDPNHQDFSMRGWRPEGRILWEHLKLKKGVMLVSWARTGAEYQRIHNEKLKWIEREMPRSKAIILEDGISKGSVCQPDDILIDGNIKHKRAWLKAGGRFIQFETARQTIAELK